MKRTSALAWLTMILSVSAASAAPWVMWGKVYNVPTVAFNDQINPYMTPPVAGDVTAPLGGYPVDGTTTWVLNNGNNWTFDAVAGNNVPEISTTDRSNAQVWAATYITAPTGGTMTFGASADDRTVVFLNFEEKWRNVNTTQTLTLRTGLNYLLVGFIEFGGGFHGSTSMTLPGDATVAATYNPLDLPQVPPVISLSSDLVNGEVASPGTAQTFSLVASTPQGDPAELTSVLLNGVEQIVTPVASLDLNLALPAGASSYEIDAVAENTVTNATVVLSEDYTFYGVNPPTGSDITAEVNSPADGARIAWITDFSGKAFTAGGGAISVPDTLLGSVFTNTTFSGSAAVRFIETSPLGRNYDAFGPFPGYPADNFGIRLTGIIGLSDSGTHTFSGGADDVIKITVDGNIVVDKLASINSSAIALDAGDHVILVEFTEYGGGAWYSWNRSGPGTMDFTAIIYEAPPLAGYSLEYDYVQSGVQPGLLVARDFNYSGGYHYPRTGGEPILHTRYISQPNQNYGPYAPVGSPVNADNFGVEAAGEFYAEADDTYTFGGGADDRIAVIVDGQTLYQNASFVDTGLFPAQASIFLTEGWHSLLVVFLEGGGGANFAAYWQRTGNTGWKNFASGSLRSATDAVTLTAQIATASSDVGDAGSDGLLGQWDTNTVADGSYLVRLRVTDAEGTTESVEITVEVDNSNSCDDLEALVQSEFCAALDLPTSLEELDAAVHQTITDVFASDGPPNDQSPVDCRQQIYDSLFTP